MKGSSASYSREKRSEVMSRVRSKDTKPEMFVRSAAFRATRSKRSKRVRIHEERGR